MLGAAVLCPAEASTMLRAFQALCFCLNCQREWYETAKSESPLNAACHADMSAFVTSPNGIVKLLRPIGRTYNHDALTAAIDTIKLHQKLCFEAAASIMLPRWPLRQDAVNLICTANVSSEQTM